MLRKEILSNFKATLRAEILRNLNNLRAEV